MGRKVIFVAGHGCKVNVQFLRTREFSKVGNDESRRQLTSPVRAEVKEDDAVPIFNGVFTDDRRDDEFIGDVSFIRMFQARGCIWFLRSFCQGYDIVSFFNAFPAFIAVHGVITTADGGDFADAEFCAFIFKFLQEFTGTAGQYVAAVEEGMDIDFFQAEAFCHFEEAEECCSLL